MRRAIAIGFLALTMAGAAKADALYETRFRGTESCGPVTERLSGRLTVDIVQGVAAVDWGTGDVAGLELVHEHIAGKRRTSIYVRPVFDDLTGFGENVVGWERVIITGNLGLTKVRGTFERLDDGSCFVQGAFKAKLTR